MKTKKIVITGGPCAGKTSGLNYLEKELSKFGYKVVFMNETATELITNGITYNSTSTNIDFQKTIASLQLEKERLYMECCEKLPDEKVLLVCDRGVMDGKAYMSDEDYHKMLAELGIDEIQLRDNYDAVFHMVTAAKGAPEFYTTANNQARRENLQEAIVADDKTLSCWVGHPHFRAIDNSTDFENKKRRLVKEICTFLGEPMPFEIERKFLIKYPDVVKLASLENCRKVDIIQTYLQSPEGVERRVRQRGLDGSYIFTETTKRKVTDVKRVETERRITEREYLSLLNEADTDLHQVRKQRYCLMENNNYFEIDVYPFAKETAICEIELASEEQKFFIPEFIEPIKEVTGDKAFSNRGIAEEIPFELR